MIHTWDRLRDPAQWIELSTLTPRFHRVMPRLVDRMLHVFEREVALTEETIGIFAMGRLSVEDFLEIAFLCNNGFGFAAIKLLRGLYERVVTAEYISTDAAIARDFHDFYHVQQQKLYKRAQSVYPGKVTNAQLLNMSADEYKLLEARFSVAKCTECGMGKQMSFSKLDLLSMARKASDSLRQRYGSSSVERELERAYFLCADIPNVHIHASMHSFEKRLTRSDGMWSPSQDEEVRLAISSAHVLMLVALHTQNATFRLELGDALRELGNDFELAWNNVPTEPTE